MSKTGEPTLLATDKGDFQLGPVIGRGGFGVVYQGLCVKDGAFVAIKQIKLGAVSEDQKKSIMSEIQLLRRLNNKNIVHYITYSATDLYLNIVMEYVENGSLLKILDKYGRFPETLVAAYMYQVLEGLVYLHEQGVVHRDIKGANLLVTKDGTIKIADFGISATRDSSDLEDVSGTPYWMAPEIIELSGATTKSDIWSVGCTVVELLTGKPPYFELSPMSVMFHIVQDEYPPLPESISNNCRDWLLCSFKKDPNQRPSAKQMLVHKWLQDAKTSHSDADGAKRIVKEFATIRKAGISNNKKTFKDLFKNISSSGSGQQAQDGTTTAAAAASPPAKGNDSNTGAAAPPKHTKSIMTLLAGVHSSPSKKDEQKPSRHVCLGEGFSQKPPSAFQASLSDLSIGEDDDFETNAQDSINLKTNSIKTGKGSALSLAVSKNSYNNLQCALASLSLDPKPKEAPAEPVKPAEKSSELDDLFGFDDDNDNDTFDFPTLSIDRNKAAAAAAAVGGLPIAESTPKSVKPEQPSDSAQTEAKATEFRLKRKNEGYGTLSIGDSDDMDMDDFDATEGFIQGKNGAGDILQMRTFGNAGAAEAVDDVDFDAVLEEEDEEEDNAEARVLRETQGYLQESIMSAYNVLTREGVRDTEALETLETLAKNIDGGMIVRDKAFKQVGLSQLVDFLLRTDSDGICAAPLLRIINGLTCANPELQNMLGLSEGIAPVARFIGSSKQDVLMQVAVFYSQLYATTPALFFTCGGCGNLVKLLYKAYKVFSSAPSSASSPSSSTSTSTTTTTSSSSSQLAGARSQHHKRTAHAQQLRVAGQDSEGSEHTPGELPCVVLRVILKTLEGDRGRSFFNVARSYLRNELLKTLREAAQALQEDAEATKLVWRVALMMASTDLVVKRAICEPNFVRCMLESARTGPWDARVSIVKALEEVSCDQQNIERLAKEGAISLLVKQLQATDVSEATAGSAAGTGAAIAMAMGGGSSKATAAAAAGDAQRKNMKHHLLITLSNIVKLNHDRQAKLLKLGIVPILCKYHTEMPFLNDVIVPLLCDLFKAARKYDAFAESEAYKTFFALLANPIYSSRAIECLALWAKVKAIRSKICKRVSIIASAFTAAAIEWPAFLQPLTSIATQSHTFSTKVWESKALPLAILSRLPKASPEQIRLIVDLLGTVYKKAKGDKEALAAEYKVLDVLKKTRELNKSKVVVESLIDELIKTFESSS